MVYGLFIDYRNGFVSFKTFESELAREVFMIPLRAQPVRLRPVTYKA